MLLAKAASKDLSQRIKREKVSTHSICQASAYIKLPVSVSQSKIPGQAWSQGMEKWSQPLVECL